MKHTKQFIDKYGPWALITGASSGIGAEFARQLARRGLNVALTARRGDRLKSLATQIEKETGVAALTITADLSSTEAIHDLVAAVEQLDIGLLVNNAGREDTGSFLHSDVADAVHTVDLNVRAPVLLTHAIGRRIAERGTGGVVFLSSIVAFQGVPLTANYAATKAFDLVLAEGLALELRQYGIDTLAVAPGFTKTELAPDLDFTGTPIRPLEPAKVVATALHALGRKTLVVPGFTNRFLYVTGKYLQPRRWSSRAFGRVYRKVLRAKLSESVAPNPVTVDG